MKSLRRGLIIRTAAACAITFALAGVALYLSMRASLIREFDHALAARANSVAGNAEYNGDRLEVDWEELGLATASASNSRPEFVQLFSESGADLSRSPSLGDKTLPFLDADETPRHDFITLPNGAPARRLTLRFTPRVDGDSSTVGKAAARPVIIAVAVDARDFHRSLARIAWQIAVVFSLAAAAAVAAIAYAISFGLRPLHALANRIAAHEIDDLSKRIELADAPDELTPVVLRLNELLDRIQISFDREKSFTADAAHELRTPLAGLATTLEVCANRPRSASEYREAVTRCLQTVRQMHRMTETLLLLARADSHQLQPRLRTVELRPMLEQAWQPLDPRARERQLQLHWHVPESTSVHTESASVHTDPDLLSIVLTTLFENALAHSDPGGWIRIEWQGDSSTLQLTNSGCALDPASADRIFERFWRGDTARSNNGAHAGLGLSLCKKIVTLLKGKISARVLEGGIFAVVLSFTPRTALLPSAAAAREAAELSPR